jgi:hypothetical protein
MLARIAEVVGIAPQRLQELWSAGASSAPGGSPPPPPAPPKRVPTRHISGGRGSIVRQAVLQLVSYPVIAREVTEVEKAALEACDEPGVELLRGLIENLQEHPAQNPAQVIERWAGKPGGDSLEKLLQREQIVADAVAAAGELHGALNELAHRVIEGRLKQLEEKSASAPLGPEELQEYQRLMSHKVPRGARGG